MSKERRSDTTSRRIIAIGDIHGCAVELEELLQKINPKVDDLFIFLGDYVDRGPYSKHVVDIILELKSRVEVIALKGNHESLFEDFLHRPNTSTAGMFILNGGTSTLASYASEQGGYEIPKEHVDFYTNLAYYHETQEFFFVHGGVPDMNLADIPNLPKNAIEELIWMREPFLESAYDWGKTIVHGHTPVPQIEVKPNRINLDTGCVFDGVLTALDVTSMSVFQVERGRKHEKPRFISDPKMGPRVALRYDGRMPVIAKNEAGEEMSFLTLNYNQFGLLLEPANANSVLMIGDLIDGQIGRHANLAVDFVGRVVRIDRRGSQTVYGIQLDQITAGADGRQWIQRPGDEV